MEFVTRRHSFRIRGFGAFLAMVGLLATVLVAVPLAAPVAPAAANTDFNPGYMISDEKFFDSSSMNEAAIASFIQREGSRCTSNCLKDFRQSTTSRPSDSYCTGYQGAGGETAARIIEKTARSCGINPQVLLVLLEKEQTLITHASPSNTRYTIATGYACPDTAACDERYYGFHNQVYSAARQFKIYAEGRYFTYFAPGRTWNVRWHPDASCGSSPVFIQNTATAALYYYTPYQPNAAALRAGPGGTGDSCSAYGNRNFSRFFNQWFGSPIATTSGGIAGVWRANGGGSGWIGSPVAGMEYDGANGGGWKQQFQNAIIYYSANGTAGALRSGTSIHNAYLAQGGTGGSLGWPASDENCESSGCAIAFQAGTLAWNAQSKAIILVEGAIEKGWQAAGGITGELGAPRMPAWRENANGGGTMQAFARGDVLSSPAGVAAFRGNTALYREYASQRGPAGQYGWPKSGEHCETAGCSINFTGGVLTWDAAGGPLQRLDGRFAAVWIAEGGVSHWAGMPTGAMRAADGGYSQQFRKGTFYMKSGGPVVGWGAWSLLHQEFLKQGGPGGALGWPTSGDICNHLGCFVTFERGNLVRPHSTGTISAIAPEFFETWRNEGGLSGRVGAPSGPASAVSGGLVQQFTNATGYAKAGVGAVLLQNGTGLVARYRELGGVTSSLGWPKTTETCVDGVGCSITFEHGNLTWDLGSRRTQAVEGKISAAWLAEGGLRHWLGAATGAAVQADGGTKQDFRSGTLYVRNGGEAVGWSSGSLLHQAYRQRGGETGSLGWPVTGDACSSTGCLVLLERGNLVRNYENGAISSVSSELFDVWREGGAMSSWMGPPNGPASAQSGGLTQDFRSAYGYAKNGTTGAFLKKGTALTNHYRALGGPTGSLGWPVGGEACDASRGECAIPFERGSLVWSASNGQITRR